MKLTNIIVIAMIIFLIVACGGGSSSAPEPAITVVADNVVTEETEEEEEPDPNAIYDTTAELVAAKSFLFEQEYKVFVSYKNDSHRSAYLSVCSEFTEGESGIKVNYQSCMLRTSIEGNFTSMVAVANDKNRLVMAIWYFDDIENPRYATWENDIAANGERKFEVN